MNTLVDQLARYRTIATRITSLERQTITPWGREVTHLLSTYEALLEKVEALAVALMAMCEGHHEVQGYCPADGARWPCATAQAAEQALKPMAETP